MKIDNTRLERQTVGVDKWFDHNCIGILDYATGVGKTYTAILALQRLLKVSAKTVVILVPSDALRTQWKKELSKNFYKKDLNTIELFTAQELIERDITVICDILVVDEIHEFTSDDRLQLINNQRIQRKGILGLTASSDDKNFRLIKHYIPIIDRITEKVARENGWIAAFIEYNLELELNEEEKEMYDKYSKAISKTMPKFDNDLTLAQNCLSGGYAKKRDKTTKKRKYYINKHWAIAVAYKKGWNENLNMSIDRHRQLQELWNPNKIIGYARTLMNAIRKRKQLLCLAEAKYKASLELLDKFNQVKTIIFSESTDFADTIYRKAKEKEHKIVVYHSQLETVMKPSPKTGKLIKFGKTRLKREALEALDTGKARIISTAKSLDRGFDAKDLRFGLTTSGTQNPTQYKQRGGRVKRKEEDDGIFGDTTVLLVNLYIKDTRDEVWLNNRQQKAKHDIISVTDVNQIGYTPPPNKEFLLTDL